MIKKLEDQTACLQGGKAWQPNLTAEELQEVVADTSSCPLQWAAVLHKQKPHLITKRDQKDLF